ncbi:MAG TPA: hypothetical protein VMS93_13930 [Candidatus Saccharimonadales bacterium]|nr:hypothetical protein [Candidatus Saccharimonadales bacterium]
MKRLLVCTLCLATLLPALARAQDEGDWRPPRPGRGMERGYRDGRSQRRYRRHPHYRSHLEVFANGGFSGGVEDRGWDGYGDWRGHGLDGGVAVEAGLRYWVARGVAVGVSGGYHDLGRLNGPGPYYAMSGPPMDGGSHLSVFPVTADLTLEPMTYGMVRPFAKIGAGPYFLNGLSDWENATGRFDHGNDSVRFGFHGGGGLNFRVGRLGYSVEAAWHAVDVNQGPYDHFTLLAGVHFH